MIPLPTIDRPLLLDTAAVDLIENLGASVRELGAEIRETADWLDERSEVLLDIAAGMPQGPGRPAAQRRQLVRDEAARLRARALLLRLKAASLAESMPAEGGAA